MSLSSALKPRGLAPYLRLDVSATFEVFRALMFIGAEPNGCLLSSAFINKSTGSIRAKYLSLGAHIKAQYLSLEKHTWSTKHNTYLSA